MDDRLYEILMKLPRKNLINIMWEALDEMQAYNGRTKTYCIATAIGAESNQKSDGRLSYTVSKLSEIKKNTESNCFL